ncbi:MAG: hypothetical protein IPH13_06805 [Planctomycetes bacterium]|nr:hypothetical protein [Planctomycetota bacterium]MCC7170308.1 hypothetical protein [Planctomycetota bacterium]
MNITRVSVCLTVLLSISTAISIALPDVRSSPSMSMKSTWSTFEGPMFSVPCPDDWKLVDPFTVDYPYYGYGFLPEAPPAGSAVAFFTRRDEMAEVFLIRGDDAVLRDAELRARTMMLAQPNVEVLPERTLALRNGMTLSLTVARVKPPFEGRPMLVYFIGGVDLGFGVRLLVNGGGPESGDPVGNSSAIVRGLTLPRL